MITTPLFIVEVLLSRTFKGNVVKNKRNSGEVLALKCNQTYSLHSFSLPLWACCGIWSGPYRMPQYHGYISIPNSDKFVLPCMKSTINRRGPSSNVWTWRPFWRAQYKYYYSLTERRLRPYEPADDICMFNDKWPGIDNGHASLNL